MEGVPHGGGDFFTIKQDPEIDDQAANELDR